MKVIYKITYPNKKIYIGKDENGVILRYIGSPQTDIDKDFTWEELQKVTLTKEILFYSEDISDSDLHEKEYECIKKFCSNNPAIGYNIVPKFDPKACDACDKKCAFSAPS